MMKKYKHILIGFGLSYLGISLMTWWGILSMNIYEIPFVNLTGFITHLGGIL